jgi:hypothetical protein
MHREPYRAPDVFIAALGRSGSTMLANRLTTPPDRWVLIQPRFANASTGSDLFSQAVLFDDTLGTPPSRSEGESHYEAVERVFAPALNRLSRWGLKEVRHDLYQPTIDLLSPRQVIVLVRDLRDVAVSLLEKMSSDGDSQYDHAWLRKYLTDTPAAIVELLKTADANATKLVRYEDLVADSTTSDQLAEWLDWPLDGQPDRGLRQVYRRDREVDLHGGVVTQAALGRHTQSAHPDAPELTAWIQTHHAEFHERFDYS